MGKSKTWFFRNNAFLQGLNTPDIALLDKHSSVVRIKARQTLWETGDVADAVYWMHSGVIVLQRSGKGDRSTILDFRGGADVLSAESYFMDGAHVVTARTHERSELLRIDVSALRHVGQHHPEFASRLGAVLAKNKRFEAQWRTFLMHRSVRARVIGALLRLSGKFGTSIENGVRLEIGLTHRQIAAFIGATREAVSVAIHQLKRDELLGFEGKQAVLYHLNDIQDLLSS